MMAESIWPGMFQAEADIGSAVTVITTTNASSLICSISSLYCLDVICHGQITRSTELLVSSLAQTDALAKLLIEKGLITREEFMQKISEERATYQKILNPIKQ
jgi:hypothetical protein